MYNSLWKCLLFFFFFGFRAMSLHLIFFLFLTVPTVYMNNGAIRSLDRGWRIDASGYPLAYDTTLYYAVPILLILNNILLNIYFLFSAPYSSNRKNYIGK